MLILSLQNRPSGYLLAHDTGFLLEQSLEDRAPWSFQSADLEELIMNDVNYYETYHPESRPRKSRLKAPLPRAVHYDPPRKIWPIAITGALLLATIPSLVVADRDDFLSIW